MQKREPIWPMLFRKRVLFGEPAEQNGVVSPRRHGRIEEEWGVLLVVWPIAGRDEVGHNFIVYFGFK
jgi:hypothetical protein